MTTSGIDSWLRDVVRREGHQHLYQRADDVRAYLKCLELPEESAREIFGRIVGVLASEIETTVQTAAHPGATMNSYLFFRSLEESGRPYRVSQGWARYLDRLIDLLDQFHHTIFEERGWIPLAFDSTTAGRLASPLYHVQGSALRGPRFSVEFDVDLAQLASVLEKVGFYVPQNDLLGFSISDGPSEDSIFCIQDDGCFRALLTGAAKSGDPNAGQILTHFKEDEEPWVAELARRLLVAHFSRAF